MDWLPLLVGAIVGALAGLLVQNIMFPELQARIRAQRFRKLLSAVNAAWTAFERLHPRLILVRGGWDKQGYFPEATVTMRLEAPPFVLREDLATDFREPHRREWEEAKLWDGEQIGIAGYLDGRTTDDPEDDVAERDLHFELRVHKYRYFDRLATHHLLVNGSVDEQAGLREIAGSPTPNGPVPAFPTPCSVGVSLFCERGDVLVLTRRSSKQATGGHWEGGKIFNAVGEGATPKDFSASFDGTLTSTPHVVAGRGLNEEMGLAEDDIRSCEIRIHSFAWATDQLDFKFFGLAITDMPQLEVRDRFRAKASDGGESDGLLFVPVRTRNECVKLLARIRDELEDWTPEGVFSTIRSLLVLQKLRQRDALELFSTTSGSSAR